jgi:hypothetical protein
MIIYEWGRFLWWLNQCQNAAATQTVVAIVSAFVAMVALFIAIRSPVWQQRRIRVEDRETTIVALREEVTMFAPQCEILLEYLCRPGANLKPRSASLPLLTVFDSVASKLGLLSRDQIVHIVSFSAQLADLRYVASTLPRPQQLDDEDRLLLAGMTVNACHYAGRFLESVPAPVGKEDDYKKLFSRLKAATDDRRGLPWNATDIENRT